MAEITIAVEAIIGGSKSTLLKSVENNRLGSHLNPLLSRPDEVKVHRESEAVLRYVDNQFYPAFYLPSNEVLLQTGHQKYPVFKATKSELLFLSQINILLAHIKEEMDDRKRGGVTFWERSRFSMKHVFVKNLRQQNAFTPDQNRVYDFLFNHSTHVLHPPDLFVYLYTKPETAFKRMQKRRKSGEGLAADEDLPIEYFRVLHDLHEEMFNVELPDMFRKLGLDPRDTILFIDADKDLNEHEFIGFHQYILDRITKVLMQRKLSSGQLSIDLRRDKPAE